MNEQTIQYSKDAQSALRGAEQRVVQGISTLLAPRELAMSARDAGAKHIEFFDREGKLVCEDNGHGYSVLDQLLERIILPWVPAKSAKNQGLGSRLLGMAVHYAESRNFSDDYPYLIFETQGNARDALRVALYRNQYTTATMPRFKVFGTTRSSGSRVTYCGGSPSHNTVRMFNADAAVGIGKALNARFFDVPEDVEIWAPNHQADGQGRMRVYGTRHYLTGLKTKKTKAKQLPSVSADGWDISTFLVGDQDNMYQHTGRRLGGKVIVVYDNEVYMTLPGPFPVEPFGVLYGKGSVLLVLTPKDDSVAKPEIGRMALVSGSGETLFLSEELGPVFAKKHPKELREHIDAASKKSGTDCQRNAESKPNDELTKCFGDLFKTFSDGGRKKVRATDKQYSRSGEKGLDETKHPINGEHPELGNLEEDPANPFPANRRSPTGGVLFEEVPVIPPPNGRVKRVKKVQAKGLPLIDVIWDDALESPAHYARSGMLNQVTINYNHPDIQKLTILSLFKSKRLTDTALRTALATSATLVVANAQWAIKEGVACELEDTEASWLVDDAMFSRALTASPIVLYYASTPRNERGVRVTDVDSPEIGRSAAAGR
jgi:hypothetical protein